MFINDVELHAQGNANFIDDLAVSPDLLHVYPVVANVAHAQILHIDLETALNCAGVVSILLAKDIQGINNIGNIEADEVLLAEQTVVYQGQPIALVIADSAENARFAATTVHVHYKPLPAVFDAITAQAQGLQISPARIFSLGDIHSAWQDCDLIVEGQTHSGAQEHIYLETQTALAYPVENDALKVLSATQSPSMTQKMLARVLGCAMSQIEVEVVRLGGGFGGKEEQATAFAAMAALAAQHTKRPVKICLSRTEDMRLTGKRHPYNADFKIGLTKAGKILAYQVSFYQNAGATADLSLAILERTLFHASNSYFIPNVQATAFSCRTHLPPNTAFRGFGAPQAMFVLEAAIFKAAQALNLDPADIQRANLLYDGALFPYGMQAERCQALACWQQLHADFPIADTQAAITSFNAEHQLTKKALAIMPICFGIAFTATFLNQADALVHIYTDGSVSISCGAVEMGQGIKEKIRHIAANVFSINKSRIKIESTNTRRIANMSPTAASVGSDTNGQATLLACQQLLQGLKNVAATLLNKTDIENIQLQNEQVYLNAQPTGISWTQLITQSYLTRTALSAHAHYATPNLAFNRNLEQGNPFAYHVYGCAAIEVTVDCLRGIYQIDKVSVVHDSGRSLAVNIDRGQIEGAIVQGLGWMTIEEILHDEHGRLLTDNLATYKIPDIYFAPDIEIRFLENADNIDGIFHSKAIGEPPLMYGIGVYFALVKAILAFNPDWQMAFNAPLTPEKVLLALYAVEYIDK